MGKSDRSLTPQKSRIERETDRRTDGRREKAVGRMTFNRIAKLHAVSKKKKQESKLENNQNLGCPSCTYMYYTAYGCNSSYTLYYSAP